jgi:hypothetical protein
MVNPLRGALPAGRETGSDENAHRIAQNLGNGKAHHQPGASSAWRIISLAHHQPGASSACQLKVICPGLMKIIAMCEWVYEK